MIAMITDACPAAVQVLAAVLTSMQRESMVALRNRVLVDEPPTNFVVHFCRQAASLPEVAAKMHAEGMATPPAVPSPPPAAAAVRGRCGGGLGMGGVAMPSACVLVATSGRLAACGQKATTNAMGSSSTSTRLRRATMLSRYMLFSCAASTCTAAGQASVITAIIVCKPQT